MAAPVDDDLDPQTTARPQPPGRSRLGGTQAGRSRLLLLVGLIGLGLLVAMAVVGLVLYQTGVDHYHRPGPAQRAVTIEIPKGAGLNQIAGLLADGGVLTASPLDQWVFRLGARFSGQSVRLKAGEFAFPARASMHDAVAIMVAGKVVLHKFTLPEGLTSLQAVALLNQAEVMTGDVSAIPPEGTLLPETYLYVKGDERAAVLARMQSAMSRAVSEIWARRSNAVTLLKRPEDMLTLASIIEKETGVPAERPLIAGVFHNRLRLGMPLQSDPTVIYAVAGPAGLDRPLTRADLQRDHPYNSYTRNGLPPGPIANPGRAALSAAVNPAKTKALYFVADGSGGHAFAETLAGHNRNVARWRLIERKAKQ